MYNLLVFLVLTTSVGQLKCQNLDWIARRLRRNADCPSGTELDVATNACVIPFRSSGIGCPGGTKKNYNDECIPIGIRRVAAPYALLGGCLPGQTRNPNTGYCESCPPGQERDGETNECVVIVRRSLDGCPDGTVRNDIDQCVPIGTRRVADPESFIAECNGGMIRDSYTGECVSCPPGSERYSDTNDCIVALRRSLDGCPEGSVRNSKGECFPVLLKRLTAAQNLFKAGCIKGTTRDATTGKCVGCPPGSERDSETNECVPILDLATSSR